MRKEKILERARGFWGRAKNCNTIARSRVEKGMQYSYRDRRARHRFMTREYIMQMNAGAREYDVKYSAMVCGLNRAGIEVNRKVMSDLVKNEPLSFRALAEISKLF